MSATAQQHEPLPIALHRPLVSLDLETTGLDTQNDRIVEIACIKLLPDGTRQTLLHRINPERPIAPAASAVHGITDEDVRGAPRFAQLADAIEAFCRDADLTGFNVERFDLPMMRAEFGRLQRTFPGPHTSVIDSCRIFFAKEPRDLSAAVRLYCGRELVGAHGAEADAVAALDVLLGQLRRYGDLPRDAYGLHGFCHPQKPEWLDEEGKVVWRGDEAAIGFGKHRNQTLRELAQAQPDYLRWIAQESRLSAQVKQLCADALQGVFPALDAKTRAAIASAQGAPKAATTTVAAATNAPAPAAAPAQTTDSTPARIGRHGQTSLF